MPKFPTDDIQAIAQIPSVFAQSQNPSTGSSDLVRGPWSQDKSGEATSFFPSIEIQGKRWDQLFPYKLIVVKPAESNGQISYFPVSEGSTSVSFTNRDSNFQSLPFKLAFERDTSSWEFALPITPQQISITNQFAINTSATLRGIIEEHNGTKFKMINMAGTFGVWPNRGNVSPTNAGAESSLQTLFGGSIQVFSNLSANINRTINTFQGRTFGNRSPSPDISQQIGSYSGTGYAQALLLDQFLEQYSERKKKADWATYRLAFHMPKQNQTFLVTPLQFTYNQAVDSPNEYKFSLQLKAFRRITLSQGFDTSVTPPNPLSSNTLQNILRGITEARRALGSAFNLVRAVRSDFNGPFTALRETTLFIKGLTGLAAAAVDLPDNIIEDAKFAIADSLANLDKASIQANAVTSKLIGDIDSTKQFKAGLEGQPLSNAVSDQNSANSASSKTSPLNKLFANPVQNFDLFNQVDTTSINFSPSVQDAIDQEIARTSLLTVDDIRTHKNTLQDLAYQISNAFGTGDITFSRVYGRAAPKERLQEITIDEYDILKKLYDVIQGLGGLIMNDDINQNQNAAYEFVKSEAQDADITFQESNTKVRAPVPFGLTMEQIAARYLNDQERWLEIVTINALKSPYIDEVGFTRDFLSNGDGRQFNINSNADLFVGQKITLFSNNQPKQRRTIINIEKINDTNFLITVDGLDNLQIFSTVQSAKMLAYLPGTVNSQDQIFIPSNLPVTDDLITRPIPAAQDDVLSSLSKVDLLLTDDNDLAIDSFGDLRLSFGLTNLLQALRIKFITEPGQIIRHVSFGSGLRPGISTADNSAENIYNSISSLIAQDSRFAGIQRLEVVLDGPVLTVNLSVFIANGLGVFPISFRLAS